MGLAFRPDFRLTVEGQDITDRIQPYVMSISLTDHAGDEADRLSLHLALPAQLTTPAKGAVLRLGLGFNGHLIDKGQFVVDEVSVSGPPRVVTLVAKSAPMDGSKHAATLQTQKTRSWDTLTLEDLLNTVAANHHLVPKISPSLASISLDHLDQVGESDLNLMMRLSKRYGAISKPANGHWLFLKVGEGKTASGQPLTDITLRPAEVSTWQVSSSSRGKSRRVTATYTNHSTGKTEEISVGTGEPVFKIVYKYPNKEDAVARAMAQSNTFKTDGDTLSLTLPATPRLLTLVAEGHITLQGFGDLEDKRWKINTLGFVLDQSGMKMTMNGVGAAESKK